MDYKQIGRKFEKSWAKKTNSKVTIGSGNLWFQKEDCQNKNWLFQNKATDKDYYTLKKSDLEKLKNNANKISRKYAFVIEFNSSIYEERTCYVIIPEKLYEEAMGEEQLVPCDLDKIYEEILDKQIKLFKDKLDQRWLDDLRQLIISKKTKDSEMYEGQFVILNEIDFLKIFKRDFVK